MNNKLINVLSIDFYTLNKTINQDTSYLIMNSDTKNDLLKTGGDEFISHYLAVSKNNKGYGCYRGIPIAICEKLGRGEIEVVNR